MYLIRYALYVSRLKLFHLDKLFNVTRVTNNNYNNQISSFLSISMRGIASGSAILTGPNNRLETV